MKTPKTTERSFSLIETVIALAILTFLIIEVSAVQGNSIVFSDYGRNITQATWLAKRVMSGVEYLWLTKPFKDLAQKVPEQPFEDFKDYSYSLEIKEWKFPFVQMLQMALGGGPKAKEDTAGEEQKPDQGGLGNMMEQAVKFIFGDEPIFMTAYVEVSWAEGAARNNTSMTYLLTNQAKLDDFIASKKQTYDRLTKKATTPTTTTPPGQNPANPNGANPNPNGGNPNPNGANPNPNGGNPNPNGGQQTKPPGGDDSSGGDNGGSP